MEITIDASELKDEGKEIIQGLADFVELKTGAEVTNESNQITIRGEEVVISKKYLRVLSRKYLHKRELKDFYRVISGDESVLKIKERKIYEE
jgi:hypothetical protein